MMMIPTLLFMLDTANGLITLQIFKFDTFYALLLMDFKSSPGGGAARDEEGVSSCCIALLHLESLQGRDAEKKRYVSHCFEEAMGSQKA